MIVQKEWDTIWVRQVKVGTASETTTALGYILTYLLTIAIQEEEDQWLVDKTTDRQGKARQER